MIQLSASALTAVTCLKTRRPSNRSRLRGNSSLSSSKPSFTQTRQALRDGEEDASVGKAAARRNIVSVTELERPVVIVVVAPAV